MSDLQKAARRQLQQFIERIEHLEEERSGLGGDIRDVYLEAKGVGFDVKVIRQVIKLRRKSQTERDEEEALLDTYLRALGMQGQLFDDGGDEPEPTISINGGPAHPMSVVKEAVAQVRREREAEAAE